jgi:hypothetical protein
MVEARASLYLTLLVLALLGAAVLHFQPYSADWPGTAYTTPARRYIHAALQQDSAELRHLSATASPVAWALAAARRHPPSLALWATHSQAWTGERHGDTTVVFVYPEGRTCEAAPIVLRFVGTGDEARVVDARSGCFDTR